jgi:hypothetical protein
MDKIHNYKVNRKIAEILNYFVMELNDDINRGKIAHQIKKFLEDENIKWETVNLYTPTDRIDMGYIDIRIDDELYPLSEIIELNEENFTDYCFRWESGDLNNEDTIKLFQYLINEGRAWGVQVPYGKIADDLVGAGYCTLPCRETFVSYIWGKSRIPTKYELKPNAIGTDEYVQKRKELNDDEFYEWKSSVEELNKEQI